MNNFEDQLHWSCELVLEGTWEEGGAYRQTGAGLMRHRALIIKVHRLSVDTRNPTEIFPARELHDEFIILGNVFSQQNVMQIRILGGSEQTEGNQSSQGWLQKDDCRMMISNISGCYRTIKKGYLTVSSLKTWYVLFIFVSPVTITQMVPSKQPWYT